MPFILANALSVNVLMDGWEKGDLTEHSICGVHQQRDITCATCQARIPFARKTCEACKPYPGNGWVPDLNEDGEWSYLPTSGKQPLKQCPTCKGAGTVAFNLVAASGKCEAALCVDGYRTISRYQIIKERCRTCHATGFELFDPFSNTTWEQACERHRQATGHDLGCEPASECSCGAFFYGTDQPGYQDQLATLYTDIAKLAGPSRICGRCGQSLVWSKHPDREGRLWCQPCGEYPAMEGPQAHTCKVHIVLLTPESVVRMENDARHRMLDNIVWWTPGADGRLEVLV